VPCLLGVTVGMGVMMLVVAYGLGSIVLARPGVLRLLNWLGAAFLLWLAWRIATSGRSDTPAGPRPVGFVGAAAFQWINPKSWLVCASAAGAHLGAGSGSALSQATALGGLFVLAALPCCLAWLAFGATAQRWLRTDRARRTFSAAMAALLAASAVSSLAR
jgi:threonine/homoserine/homoserine lactone efflux protein